MILFFGRVLLSLHLHHLHPHDIGLLELCPRLDLGELTDMCESMQPVVATALRSVGFKTGRARILSPPLATLLPPNSEHATRGFKAGLVLGRF